MPAGRSSAYGSDAGYPRVAAPQAVSDRTRAAGPRHASAHRGAWAWRRIRSPRSSAKGLGARHTRDGRRPWPGRVADRGDRRRYAPRARRRSSGRRSIRPRRRRLASVRRPGAARAGVGADLGRRAAGHARGRDQGQGRRPGRAGAVLAILEGHDAARSQLELAEAQKTPRRARAERPARRGPQGGRDLDEPRLRRSGRSLYKQFGATLKGKERYDAEMALYQVEMQAIKAELDLRLLAQEAASKTARQSRSKTAAPAPRSPRTRSSRPRSSWRRPACARPRSGAGRRPRPPSPGPPRRAQLGPLLRDGRRLVDGRDGRGLPERRPAHPAGRPGRGRHPRHSRCRARSRGSARSSARTSSTSIDPRALQDLASSR